MLEVECNVCCGAVGRTHGACGQGEGVTDHVGHVQRADRVGVSNGRCHTQQGIGQPRVLSTRRAAPVGKYTTLPQRTLPLVVYYSFASLVALVFSVRPQLDLPSFFFFHVCCH